MTDFAPIVGTAVPMMQMNIDTDRIVPGLATMGKDPSTFGTAVFANERYLADGTTSDPSFILNREPWSAATILIADRNFGCGSSREEAPMALKLYGFNAIIAPSFGGIFAANSYRNGIVAVELPIDQVRDLAGQAEASGGRAAMRVDLEAQAVTAPDGKVFSFRAPARPRQMLMKNVDEIGLTLTYGAKIEAYRRRDRARRPWAYAPARHDGPQS